MGIESTGRTLLKQAVGADWAVVLMMEDDPRKERPYVVGHDLPVVADGRKHRAQGNARYALKTDAEAEWKRVVEEQVTRRQRLLNPMEIDSYQVVVRAVRELVTLH